MKQHIKEIIVVEGKNDTNTLQSFFDCDTIETGGDQVNEKTIERVRQAQKTRGVIIFTVCQDVNMRLLIRKKRKHLKKWV